MSSARIKSIGALGLRVWMNSGNASMRAAHRHSDLEINFLLQGSMRYLIGGAFVTIPQNHFCVIWGAMPHQSVSADQARKMMLVTLPLAQVMLWNLPGEFLRQLLSRGVAIDPLIYKGDLHLLQQWQEDLENKSAARRQLVLDEIAARLHRMALNVVEMDSQELHFSRDVPSGDALQLAGKMAELISRKFQEAISIDQIARHVNLHPGYAMTLFRQQTGVTLNMYLTRQRVAHAQRLLAMTALPILDVAAESGFYSVSRFYEAFKAESGCTPRQFRKRLAAPGER
jgi:AraC-like DNA-binding protein